MDQAQRDKIKRKDFVFPGEKRYPIHDKSHGANALARVTQHGTPKEKQAVRSKVCSRYPDLPACSTKKYEDPLG